MIDKIWEILYLWENHNMNSNDTRLTTGTPFTNKV